MQREKHIGYSWLGTAVLLVMLAVSTGGCHFRAINLFVETQKDPDALRRWLADGHGIDERVGARKFPPLTLALFLGHADLAREIIEKGADVNTKNKAGETPLMYACVLGELDIVQELMKRGADPNARTEEGETPLDYALHSQRADLEIALALLEGGATLDANLAEIEGENCFEAQRHFYQAIFTGKLEFADYLVEKGLARLPSSPLLIVNIEAFQTHVDGRHRRGRCIPLEQGEHDLMFRYHDYRGGVITHSGPFKHFVNARPGAIYVFYYDFNADPGLVKSKILTYPSDNP